MNRQSLKVPQDHRSNQRRSNPPTKLEAQQCGASRCNSKLSQSDSYLRSWAAQKAQNGSYSEAIALLNQLIERHPQNAIDYNNRGLIYFQAGQLKRALTDYNQAIKLDPKLAKAYNNRGNYYAACGDLIAAIADYDQALDLNPSYVRAWINRGITLRDLNRYAQAIENFDIALLLGQLEGHIYAERGRTYHLWGDWNYCIADYRRALTLLPQKSESSFDRAVHLRSQVEKELEQLLAPLKSE